MSAGDLYDTDFIGWTEQQARLLREAAAQGVNLPLDWENLAEEVEDLGRSEYDAVESQVLRIVQHLLKLEFSPAREPRANWVASVREARDAIARKVRYNPGLRRRTSGMLSDIIPSAVELAAGEMDDYQETAAAAQVRRLGSARYSLAQVLGDWLPERPDQPALRRQ